MIEEEKINGETPYEIAYLRVLVADLENRNRQTEELMRVVTEQYRRITEVVSDYIFSVHIIDGNPIETVHGRGCMSITGYSPEDFVDNSFLWINMVFEEDRALVLSRVAGVLSGKDTAPFEHRIVRKDGAVRWVRNTPVCQYDISGKLLAYDGLIQDVTERKQAEEALRKSEEKYRLIADFTYDWEAWLSPDKHYLYVSPSCKRITGYSKEEFIANPGLVIAITHKADRAMVAEHYRKTENSATGPQHIDFRIITASGEERWISHSCQPVFGQDGEWLGRRSSNRDISRQRKLMDELVKARELESIGILAGGIAHDFNNLITAILGNISLAKKDLKPSDKIHMLLTSAEESSLRSRDLTRQLIVFSKRGAPVKKNLSVGEMLRKVVDIEQNLGSVQYELDISSQLWPVEADESQLSQAVINLLINAREAMGDRGLVGISADNLKVTDEDKMAVAAGNYIRISVHDSGTGIPPEHITKIFDPYFSTKYPGARKGIGLGLAITHSIIANHDGVVTVESEPGKGTTIHICLPAKQQG
jgi:PAS domain S-box-containing protein